MCKLEYRNTQGAATFLDFTTTSNVRDGISVASSGKVTFNHNTFIVPEGEEFRVKCDDGANVSPSFKATRVVNFTATLYKKDK